MLACLPACVYCWASSWNCIVCFKNKNSSLIGSIQYTERFSAFFYSISDKKWWEKKFFYLWHFYYFQSLSLCGQNCCTEKYHHSIVHGSSSTIHKCYYNLSIGHLSNVDPLTYLCSAVLCLILHKSLQNDVINIDGAGVCFGRFRGVQGLGFRYWKFNIFLTSNLYVYKNRRDRPCSGKRISRIFPMWFWNYELWNSWPLTILQQQ